MESTTSKDAVNVVKTEVTEQMPEQEAPEQVAPEQSLLGTLSEGQVPETNQNMPKQTTATTSLMQDGLPDATARGKSTVTSSVTGLNQE
jgi:hypothetical protein